MISNRESLGETLLLLHFRESSPVRAIYRLARPSPPVQACAKFREIEQRAGFYHFFVILPHRDQHLFAGCLAHSGSGRGLTIVVNRVVM